MGFACLSYILKPLLNLFSSVMCFVCGRLGILCRLCHPQTETFAVLCDLHPSSLTPQPSRAVRASPGPAGFPPVWGDVRGALCVPCTGPVIDHFSERPCSVLWNVI